MKREELIKEIGDLAQKAAENGYTTIGSILFRVAGLACINAEDLITEPVLRVVRGLKGAIENDEIASKN